ncbi:hypothetical protein VM1G_11725 [Cytospora mali]|uniref:Uncharacterized protein n=1 Tax=Cytospora mali TaxID=578113 RepID=A0A194W2E6_CYTMA|nr:hypothetical protein VM1G_11725 [Valsa mali]
MPMPGSLPSKSIEAITATEDLIHCIASHLPSRVALRNLCLVSKWFNHVFSQFLYSHIVFHDGNARMLRDPDLLSLLVANPRLNHTKALSFKLIEGSWAIGNHREVGRLVDAPGYGRMGDIRHWAGVYNDSITKITSLTPNLYHFDWENWPISQTLLETLKETCSSLRDVHAASTFEEVKPRLIPFPIPEFQNLRKLYLYEITGDLEIWIPKLVSMLGKSRYLEELGLSMSSECERQYALAGKSTEFLNFFVALVSLYKDQGHEVLRLRVLRLGYGVLLNTPRKVQRDGSLEQADYLSDFTHRAYLEELFIDNDLDVGCALSIRNAAGQIAWPTVTPSFLPNLRRFTFTSLSERSLEWLVAQPDPTFANGLCMGVGTERLAFSYVDEEGAVRRATASSIQRHIGKFHNRTFFLQKYRQTENLPLKCSTLLILKPCHKDDLAVVGGCPWIETLVICLQKQTSAPALKMIAKGLPSTKQLWIRIGMDYPLVNARDEANHRGNAIRLRDGSLVDEQPYLYGMWREKWTEMAEAMAESWSCPTEYLKIGHLGWRVLPRAKGARRSEIQALDRWEDEVEGPDVFRYNDPVRRDKPY